MSTSELQGKTVFQKIYAREVSVVEVYRNDTHGVLVFMDQFPATRGHMLIIPKEPVDQYVHVSQARAMQLQAVTYLMMHHAQEVLRPVRVNLVISGYGVPHLHVHAIPSYERNDAVRLFDYERTTPQNRVSDDELNKVRQELACPEALIKKLDAALDALAGS